MPIDFFSFPSEIRIKVYEELIVALDLITIELTPDSRPYMVRGSASLYPAILLANQAALQEASPLLYSRNIFRFGIDLPASQEEYETERAIFASFLDHIGLQNASLLRCLCIAIPSINHGTGGIQVDDKGTSTLGLIKDVCTDITTLKMVLQISITADTLSVVRAQLGSLLSLKDIKVFTYDRLLSKGLIEIIRNWSWIVRVDKLEKASDRFGSDGWGLDDDDDYYGEDYGNNENIWIGGFTGRRRYSTFCDSDN